MQLKDLSNELALAKKAAKDAGLLLVNSRNQLNKELHSNPKDIKLQADIESEILIKKIIKKSSDYPILAEESGKSDSDLGETFWVIDPLDGTANYNRKIPVCCVSIALVKEMKPILGVIYDFNNDHLYSADKFSNSSKMNDEVIKVSSNDKKKDGLLITGLPHDTDYSDESLSKLINDMQEWQKIRMLGSAAMACCYVASGKAEKYQENGIYIWDIAAGIAIVESAGGKTEVLNYKDNFQVDIVLSNSKIK